MKKLVMFFAGFLLANNLNALTPEQEIVRAAIEAELIKLEKGVQVGDVESAFRLNNVKEYCRTGKDYISPYSSVILSREQKTTCEVLKEMQARAEQK